MNQRPVVLLRHAHAEWPDFQGHDLDRPLTPQGERAARAAAGQLREAGHLPTLVLASPAVRTRQTAALVMQELGVPATALRCVERLYNAPAHTLAAELRQALGQVGPLVMLVAHNPGISELARQLAHQPAASPLAPAQWRALTL